jgi:phosphatidylinositol glycan class C protein
VNGSTSRSGDPRRSRTREGRRGGSKKRRGAWAKLLWVKQSYPDNYTDEYTFLDHLQRNPRLQPYEFWKLFADSTAIVQHVCSVAIFVCCFTGIYQERISPATVVFWSSIATIVGWVLWDFWAGQQEKEAKLSTAQEEKLELSNGDAAGTSATTLNTSKDSDATNRTPIASRPPSPHGSGPTTPVGHPTGAPTFAAYSSIPSYGERDLYLSPRTQKRLATVKSSILIYCALLGLSPILKSLTKSTTSDSIWAMSSWLMGINVAFFDYGGGVGAKYAFCASFSLLTPIDNVLYRFPASLSTNAALMASTVLASRLTSTTHVFSLTLFSIEVFGLFPVFRRHLKHVSWRAHVLATVLLVMSAGAGVGVTVSGGRWAAAIIGCVLGSIIMVLAMGICSWWLIGLQKYKNEIHGPWDPARPVVRTRWD